MTKYWLLLWCWCGWSYGTPLTLVTGDYAPYSGASLPDGGQSTRLVTKLMQSAGYHNLKVLYLPWGRGYQQTLNGLAIATFPYARTRERELDFYYSDPIHIDHLSWFTHRGSQAVLEGNWQGLRVCMPLGWSSSNFDRVVKQFALKVQSPKTLAQCLELLERQRVDLITMNDAVMADASMQRFGDPCYLQYLPYFREIEELYLIVLRQASNGSELLDRFNRALMIARANGSYDELVTGRYGSRCKKWDQNKS